MKYLKKVLENGLTIILVPMKNTKIVAIGFFVKVGSRNETDNNSGIAHFLEHMLFKGTKNRDVDKLFNELDALGAVYNAATTNQHTYYYIYGNSDDTKHLLDIMFDIYINPLFSSREISREKKVIIEEMRTRFDMPLTKLYSIVHKKMFRGTSLARDVVGEPGTIIKLTRRDLIKFRKTFYIPKNTIFVMTGNFSPSPIYRIIAPILRLLENPTTSPPDYSGEKTIILKNMTNQRKPYIYVKISEQYNQTYVLIVFPLYDMYGKKHHQIDLLSCLLSSGFSSRLKKALRSNHGITYTVTSYPIVYSDCSLFLIQMVSSPDFLSKGINIIIAELKKIKNTLITKDEMKKIINITKNENIYSLIQPVEILTYFGINFLTNPNFKPSLFGDIRKIEKINRSEIRDVAREIFVREKINLYIYGNVKDTKFRLNL
ncbi:MAG: pitrilysin family protein [Nitrososphaerota archaeon]